MQKIVLASGNQGKLIELQAILSANDVELIPQAYFNISEVEETGLSFVENALIKARHACVKTGLPCIADDSGIEVDALDGLLCKVADNSALQRRKLNSRKGPAVQATRIQTCRDTYKTVMQRTIASQKNLSTLEGVVAKLLISDGIVTGVELETKDKIISKTVVLTTGTFLGGVVHIGEKSFEAGRSGDKSSKDLDNFFREKGFNVKRLKTGTPPRIFKNTIKFDNLEKQNSDVNNPHISFLYDQYNQTPEHITPIPCHITYTNVETHEIIKSSKHLSPLFNGKINDFLSSNRSSPCILSNI